MPPRRFAWPGVKSVAPLGLWLFLCDAFQGLTPLAIGWRLFEAVRGWAVDRNHPELPIQRDNSWFVAILKGSFFTGN